MRIGILASHINRYMKPSQLSDVFHRFHATTFSVLIVMACLVFVNCNSDTAPSPITKDTLVIKDSQTGLASYYGHAFEGKETASGETFNSQEMVAAHPSYPLGTVVQVTNLEEGNTVHVRIIDRGPTDENVAEGVIIDMSKGSAEKLGMVKEGRIRVKVEVLQWGTNEYKPERRPVQ
jgi:rare lipoprotein A